MSVNWGGMLEETNKPATKEEKRIERRALAALPALLELFVVHSQFYFLLFILCPAPGDDAADLGGIDGRIGASASGVGGVSSVLSAEALGMSGSAAIWQWPGWVERLVRTSGVAYFDGSTMARAMAYAEGRIATLAIVYTLPVLFVTVNHFAAQRKVVREMFGPQGPYEAPTYKYSVRGDGYPGNPDIKNFVVLVNLKCTMEKPPLHWGLRGLCILCNT